MLLQVLPLAAQMYDVVPLCLMAQMPPFAPTGTPDEYVDDEPVGLGPRVPMVVVSPWSRGGWVNSQVFDHTSVLRFLEVLTGVAEPNISAWRRSVGTHPCSRTRR